MRGHRRPGKKWTALDRLLLLALQVYEDDLCSGCGEPRTYGMSPGSRGHYDAQITTCQGCATKQRAEAGTSKTPPGQYRYVTPDKALTHAMHHPIHVPPFHT